MAESLVLFPCDGIFCSAPQMVVIVADEMRRGQTDVLVHIEAWP